MVGRYAPSPSGRMHLGNARTALLAWLQVRQAGGSLLLRIEDLDRDRCRPEWEAGVREDLAWLGLGFDGEAPRQSTRGAAYDAALAGLGAQGLVYECYCSRAEVRAAASAPHGGEVRYPGTCRDLPEAERAARRASGRTPALRLRVPAGEVAFDDLVHGRVVEDVAATVGDIVVRRADGLHAYQLAVVVDDAEQGVTHVLRGDDLLSSTARQIVLQRLLGLPEPAYAHVPLVRAAGGARLAKRDGAATLAAARDAGRTPQALAGELAASLGLVPAGSEATPEELVGTLDLAEVGRRAGADARRVAG
jgi:glutamyl-tRNA synthetase